MTATVTASPPEWPGYAVPSQSYTTPPVRHTSHTRLFVILGITLTVVAAVITVVALLLTPPQPYYRCPPNCGGPPAAAPLAPAGVVPPPGAPVQSFPRFTPSSGQFSAAYPPELSTPPAGNGLGWEYEDGSKVSLLGRPAGNETARDIAEGLIQRYYPGAEFGYQIPNAMVGYQPGYGEIDDYYPQAAVSSAVRWRVLVMVAVKNGYALIATATGPYQQVDDNHPSGANMTAAFRISKFVNRMMWRGDPTR